MVEVSVFGRVPVAAVPVVEPVDPVLDPVGGVVEPDDAEESAPEEPELAVVGVDVLGEDELEVLPDGSVVDPPAEVDVDFCPGELPPASAVGVPVVLLLLVPDEEGSDPVVELAEPELSAGGGDAC